MRICVVHPFYDDVPTSALEVTGRYRHVESLVAALARRGLDVVVVHAFHSDRVEHRNSVEFKYAQTPYRSISRLSGGFLGIDLLVRGNLNRLMQAVKSVGADAVHMNGLTLLQPLSEVSAWCSKTNRPLTVTYHGGNPRRAPWVRAIQRRVLNRCQGAFFPTRIHAEAWVAAGVLREDQVIPCMEVSSNFKPTDRKSARERTGIKGHPVFLWNARLHPIKDPLTALKGFSSIRKAWPDARLYMIYYTSEMLADVTHAIAADPDLSNSVEMRGTIPPSGVEDYLNSADFLLQTSVRELGSYSVLEAMSCGVVPLVTDIPLFRELTDGGRWGLLFPIGDHVRMAERVLRFDLRSLAGFSQQVREAFERSLSYDCIAKTYEAALRSGMTRNADVLGD